MATEDTTFLVLAGNELQARRWANTRGLKPSQWRYLADATQLRILGNIGPFHKPDSTWALAMAGGHETRDDIDEIAEGLVLLGWVEPAQFPPRIIGTFTVALEGPAQASALIGKLTEVARLMPGTKTHAWITARVFHRMRQEVLPKGVGADDLIHLHGGRSHPVSECGESCPRAPR